MINLGETKTYCIRCYLVDISAEASPLNRYDSFYITVRKNATRQNFDREIQKIRKQYSKGNWFISEDPPEQKIEGHITKTIKVKTSRDQGDPFSIYGFVLDKNPYS